MKSNSENISPYTTVCRAHIKADTVMHCIFIAAIGMLLLLPSIKFNFKDAISKAENRTLSPLPSLYKEGKINASFFRDCDKFIGDRCGFRAQSVALVGNMDRFSILSTNKKVIFGKDGWLFYVPKTDGNNLIDYIKGNLFTKKQLAKSVSVLEDRKHWCDKNGIKFLVVIGPNKHTIYEECYPFPRPKGITRAYQLVSALENTDIDFVFSREQLLEAKTQYPAPLYYKTDTHWDNLGAMVVSKLIIDKIHSFFPDVSFPKIEFDYTVEMIPAVFVPGPIQKYDIFRFVGLKNYCIDYDITIKPRNGDWNDYYTYEMFKGACGRGGITTKGVNPALPKAVIIRDSFTMALEPFLSTQFSRADYRWKKFDNGEKEKLLADKPDIVIFELVERAIGGLQGL